MSFADKLRTYRKHAGLSQEQLAEKPGVPRQVKCGVRCVAFGDDKADYEIELNGVKSELLIIKD